MLDETIEKLLYSKSSRIIIIIIYCAILTFGKPNIRNILVLRWLLDILFKNGTVIIDCNSMFLAVVLYWKYLCRSQIYSSTFSKCFCHLPFDSYQTLFLSIRYQVFHFFSI